MILGAITRSWAEHLYTTELPRLVERARRRGAAHIELRQAYLGQHEEGAEDDWRPLVDKFARLARTFPILTFSLAIDYTYLARELNPASPQFQASLEAARVVGSGTPRLRLVDSTRFDSSWGTVEDLPPVATGVAQLARDSARQGVHLFLDSVWQPIRSMALVVREARKALGSEEASYLGLCVDPISSMRADPASDPVAEVEALPVEYISAVHIEQTRNGYTLPSVADGDLDYRRLLQVLKNKGYEDLAILEVPAGEEAFENFRESVEYVERLVGPR